MKTVIFAREIVHNKKHEESENHRPLELPGQVPLLMAGNY